jgi:AcrR family transcriptional regulator
LSSKTEYDYGVAVALPAGRKAQRTRQALTKATRAVIGETSGFNADLVAQRAGVAPATFYVYFPSKDEALAAALDDVLTELNARTLAEFAIERLLDDGLQATISRAVAAAIDVFTSSAVVLRLALARLPESRTIRGVYRVHQREARDALRLFLQRGGAAGRIAVDDVDATTSSLLVMLQGLNNPLLTNRSAGKRVVAQLVDSIVHVLSP